MTVITTEKEEDKLCRGRVRGELIAMGNLRLPKENHSLDKKFTEYHGVQDKIPSHPTRYIPIPTPSDNPPYFLEDQRFVEYLWSLKCLR